MKDLTGRDRVVLVAGIGGHGEQMKRLRSKLKFESVSVIAEDGLSWPGDKFYYVPRVLDYQSRSRVRAAFNFIEVLFVALKVFMIIRPSLLMSTGPALSVPVCVVAKIFGVQVFHLESWSRITSISNTTALIMKFNLADDIGYQYIDSVLKGKPRCEYWGHL